MSIVTVKIIMTIIILKLRINKNSINTKNSKNNDKCCKKKQQQQLQQKATSESEHAKEKCAVLLNSSLS